MEENMKNKKNWLGILVIVLVFGISFIGCGGGALLAGRWTPEHGGTAPSGLPDNLELFRDGTGECEGMSISWKAENGRFLLTISSRSLTYDYKISGGKLVLTDNNGRSETYVK